MRYWLERSVRGRLKAFSTRPQTHIPHHVITASRVETSSSQRLQLALSCTGLPLAGQNAVPDFFQ